MDTWTALQRLAEVSELSFEASSRAAPGIGWNGSGRGLVQVEVIEKAIILFHEEGEWASNEGRRLPFQNVFRWTADTDGRSICLEHLRFGVEHPVVLFDLVPVDHRTLVSSEPHMCQEDCYSAQMSLNHDNIQLRWTINGPKKAETISYVYR